MFSHLKEVSRHAGRNKFLPLFLAFYLLCIWPFLFLRYLPFQDLPQHLAAGAAIKDIVLGGPLSENFSIAGFFPDILGWLLVASLNIFFDILTVSKLLILIYFFIAPMSLYYYLDKDRKHLALLSFLFLNNYALNMGFLNFIFSVPLFFFALGAFKKGSNYFYIVTPILFISHGVTYGFFIFALTVFYFFSKKKETNKFAYALSFFIFFIALLYGLTLNGAPGIKTSIGELFVYGFVSNIETSYFNGFQFFRPDYIGLLGFLLLSVLYAKQSILERAYEKKTMLLIFMITSFIVFFPPDIRFGNGAWNVFNMRFLTLAIFFIITDLKPSKPHEKAMLGLFLLLVFANSLTLFPPYSEADRRMTQYYEPVLEKLPSGSSIYVVDETKNVAGYLFTSSHSYGVNPYIHYFTGYYSVKGGFSSQYFGLTYPTTWPLNYGAPVYYPLCYNNVSKICHVCDQKGLECSYPDDLNGSLVTGDLGAYCYNCTRPFALVCNSMPYEENNFLDTGSCIPCGIKDLSCILQNRLVIDNFDYLVAFSTSDDIGDYQINGTDPYLKNQDVIVYKIK